MSPRRPPQGGAEAIRAFLAPEHFEAAERLQRFASDEMSAFAAPHNDDEARRQARQALLVMGRDGWLTEGDCRTLCLFREAVAGISPLADSTCAVQRLAMVPLILEGSPEQRERWLGAARRGEVMGAFAMTEPEAGSDVANIQTMATAAATPGGANQIHRLNGQKCLISNAGIADFYVVFASLDRSLGSRGVSAFLVPSDSPGLHFLGPQVLSAPHPLGRLEFRDCPAELICREGFKLGMRTLDTVRVSVAAAACGMAGEALRQATAYVLQRRQFGKPLADFQLVQARLAQMAIGLEAARLLTYRAAWQRDQGQLRNTQEVAMAKAFATETAQQVVDSAMQLLGGQGMLADHPVEHLYRAVRSLRIYEGTTEIQHLIIAKELLKGAP